MHPLLHNQIPGFWRDESLCNHKPDDLAAKYMQRVAPTAQTNFSFDEIAPEYCNASFMSTVRFSLQVRARWESPIHTAHFLPRERGRGINIIMYFIGARILQRKTTLVKIATEVGRRFCFSKHRDPLRDVASCSESALPAHLLRAKAAPKDIPGDVGLLFLQLKPMSHIRGGCKRDI